MPPAWVFLDPHVEFCFDEEDDAAAAAAAAAAAEKLKRTRICATTPQDLWEFTVACLGSMKPDTTLLLQPPRISTFRLRCPMPRAVVYEEASGSVACADKGLLVLYGGLYCGPGSSERGCYLIYDAAAAVSSLSTVPPPPFARTLSSIGEGAVVQRRQHRPSSYLLAELATTHERWLPGAELHLWCSDSPAPQWAKKEIWLPREVSPEPGTHDFEADASFSFGASCLCWVDLLRGIVLCTDPEGDPQFRFIPLPEGCPAVGTSDHPDRPRMYEFRSVGCVGGAIKLAAVEGLLEGWGWDQFKLATWTLSPDLAKWTKGPEFQIKHLCATDEYLALKVRQYTPLCPVLSAQDDGVVYVVINDVELRDIVRGFKVVETKVDLKVQYVLGLDMQRNKIISTSCRIPSSAVLFMPKLLAADLCACLQGAKDRQRDAEAIDVGDSVKRVKVD